MNNQVETITVDGSHFTFDHATGITKAKHANGYTEIWSPLKKGYSLEAAFKGYLMLTDQWDRYVMMRECEGV